MFCLFVWKVKFLADQTAINAGKIVNVTQEIVVEFGLSKDVESVVRIPIVHQVKIAKIDPALLLEQMGNLVFLTLIVRLGTAVVLCRSRNVVNAARIPTVHPVRIAKIESALLLEQMGNHVVLTLTVHLVTAVVYGLSRDAVNVVRIHIAQEENSV